MSKIREQINALVQMVREDAATSDPKVVAAALVQEVPTHVLHYMAAEYLVELVRAERRREALEAERAAMQAMDDDDLTAETYRAARLPRKGSRERVEWETCTLEGREWVRREAESEKRFNANLLGMINGFVETMKVQWTQELLETTFILADGTLVSWGDATVDQHEQRRSMFERNVRVNAEGAARHIQAVQTIKATGATCLREAVSVAA